jgi:hypothetical protein
MGDKMNDTNLVNIKLKAVQGLLTGDDKNKVGIFPDLTVDNKGIENFPSDEEINTAYEAEKASYDAQEYARNRASEYPSLLELTVALYDTDDKSAVEAKRAAVKAKYPKPS